MIDNNFFKVQVKTNIISVVRIIAVVLVGLFANVAKAEYFPVVAVEDLSNPIELSPYLQFFEDPDRSVQYEDVVQGKLNHRWILNTKKVFIGVNYQSRYWFRFHISLTPKFAEGQNPILYLPMLSATIYNLNLWIPQDDGHIELTETGFLRSYSKRHIDAEVFSFNMPRQITEFTVIGWVDNYLLGTPASVPLQILSADRWRAELQKRRGIIIAFYSAMIILLLYNFCLLASLRESLYCYYLAFLTASILLCAFIDDTIGRWFFANQPELNYRLLFLVSHSMFFFYSFFVWEGLSRFYFSPVLRKCYPILMVSFFLVAFFNLLFNPIRLQNITLNVSGSIWLFLSICVIAVAIRKRVPTAVYILCAELSVLSGAMIFLLMLNGVMVFYPYSIWSLHLGFFGEALLLSLALAARTRHYQIAAIRNLKKFEDLYEQAHEGLFQYDFHSKLIKCNLTFCRLFGYASNEELQRRQSEDGAESEFNRFMKEASKALVMNGGSFSALEFLIKNESTTIPAWVVLSMRLIKDAHGQPVSVEGSLIDISERKLKETAEAKRQEAERKHELSDAKTQAKSQFLATMSHEIRTPMNGVVGISKLLDMTTLDTQQKQYVSIIRKSSEMLIEIINDILDFSKIEAGKLEIEVIEFDPRKMVDECVSLFTMQVAEKGFPLIIDFSPLVPKTIWSDPNRIRQVVINLLSNAFKFTEQGQIVLKVTAEELDQIQWIRFAVEDSGAGLTETQKNRLFNQYAQAEKSTSREYGGTGLGLSICKMLAELMAGEITVDSVIGKGSTFSFTILNHKTVNTELKTSGANHRELFAEEHDDKLLIPALKGKRLLIVAYNERFCLSYERLCKTWGMIVVSSCGDNELSTSMLLGTDLLLVDEEIYRKNMCRELIQKVAVKTLVLTSPLSTSFNISSTTSDIASKNPITLNKPLEMNALKEALLSLVTGIAAVTTTAQDGPGKATAPSSGEITVLAVQDNPVSQVVLQEMLKMLGVKLHQAANMNEALSKYKKFIEKSGSRYDLLFIDIEMPYQNGFEIAKIIRNHEEQESIKPVTIVAISGHTTMGSSQSVKAAGMNSTIIKPIKFDDLTELINRFCRSAIHSKDESPDSVEK